MQVAKSTSSACVYDQFIRIRARDRGTLGVDNVTVDANTGTNAYEESKAMFLKRLPTAIIDTGSRQRINAHWRPWSTSAMVTFALKQST